VFLAHPVLDRFLGNSDREPCWIATVTLLENAFNRKREKEGKSAYVQVSV
jgi:hypothetical protein